MANKQEIKTLVDQMPDPDRKGMLTENVNKEQIDKAVLALYEGGGASLREVIDLLDEPGSGKDAKPHYALHCVVNLALIEKDENKRRELCETMASCLDGDLSDDNKAYLCQELQWAGREEAVSAFGELLLNENLVEPAAMALVAIEAGAVEQFQAALPKAKGKCRLNILDALAALGDASATAALSDALDDEDREIRLAAGAGLAKIGSAEAVDKFLKAADVEPGWERIQATKHCLVLAEKLLETGNKDPARKIYMHLRKSRTDPSESYVRFVATMALTK
ncbi:MAG: HEAT repeat domain-containing protein [Pirellulaceae bacterium]